MIIQSSDVDHFNQEQQVGNALLPFFASTRSWFLGYLRHRPSVSFTRCITPASASAWRCHLLAISSLAGCWLRRHSPFACCGKKHAVPKLISSLPGSGHLPMLRSCPHMGLVSALAGWYSTKPGSGSAPWAAKQQVPGSRNVCCPLCWPATGDWPQVVKCTLLETA